MTIATVALGDLALKLQDGPFGSNLKSEHYVDEGVRVVRLQNIGVGYFDNRDEAFISFDHFEKLRKHECRPGDLLLATLGDPILRAAIQPDCVPIALNKADCIQLRCDPRRVSVAYLAHYLNSARAQSNAQALAHGQTRARVNLSQLRELPVPLPPIEEQRRISALLDAADALRAKRRQALAKLETITQAIFIDLFGDPRTRATSSLSNHTEVITKGTTPTSVGFEFTDHGVPFVRVQDLVAGTVLIDSIQLHVSPTTNAALRRSILRPRDVLVSIAGTIGRIAVVQDDAPPMNCNQAVALIRTSGDLDPVYLHAWMNTDHAQEQMRGSRVTGTISNLSLTSLRNLKLPVPTAEEQTQFVKQVDGTRALTFDAIASANHLESLFASLQQRAFRGEL